MQSQTTDARPTDGQGVLYASNLTRNYGLPLYILPLETRFWRIYGKVRLFFLLIICYRLYPDPYHHLYTDKSRVTLLWNDLGDAWYHRVWLVEAEYDILTPSHPSIYYTLASSLSFPAHHLSISLANGKNTTVLLSIIYHDHRSSIIYDISFIFHQSFHVHLPILPTLTFPSIFINPIPSSINDRPRFADRT